MIWNTLFQRDLTILIPRSLNADTMFTFVEGVIADHRDAKASRVSFDFGLLEFIEPVGMAILSNLVEYLRRCGATVRFIGHGHV